MSTVVKEAAKAESMLTPATAKKMKAMLFPLLGVTGIAGAAGLYGYMSGRSATENHKKDLADSLHATFGKNPQFKQDPQKFAALFGELSVVAPTVAKNPQMAHKLLTERLDTGFSLDDVHKLSVIEASRMGTAGRPQTASAGARAAILGALEKSLNIFGMETFRRTEKKFQSIDQEVADAGKLLKSTLVSEISDPSVYRNMSPEELYAHARGKAQAKNQTKQSSVEFPLYVSEACLGRMVSDRVHMMKTAAAKGGFGSGMKDMLGKGAKGLADHLAYIAPALALGGGLGLVKLVYDRSQDAHLKNEAQNQFSQLMRTNDTLKQDPQAAREAFDTICMVAPALAARPPVLRSFLEQQVQAFGRIAPDTIKGLAEANSAVDRSVSGNKGFMGGMKGVMETLHFPMGIGGKGKGGQGKGGQGEPEKKT